MAKTYYNYEETLAKLGCEEDRLRELVREGRVREFRDAGKLNYRVDEVDKLAAEVGAPPSRVGDTGILALEDSGEIPLAPLEEQGLGEAASQGLAESDMRSDSGALSLEGDTGDYKLDEAGGSTAELVLEDSGAESAGAERDPSGSDVEPSLSDSGDAGSGGFLLSDSGRGLRLEDSGGDFQDVKLDDSGAVGEVGGDAVSLDQVDRDAVEGMKKDDTVITNIGISVFDDDDLEIAADPMAKTLMTGADEHLGLDGSGGGSGLLDLTRESDDTSLGAELLEGIDMGDTAETEMQVVTEPETPEEEQEEEILPEAPVGPVGMATVPVAMVGAVEAASPAFTGLLIAGLVVLMLAGAANVAMTMGALPGYLNWLAQQVLLFLGGCIGVGGLFCLIGWLVGRQATRPRLPAKPKKAEKEKKAKKGKTARAAG